MKTKINVSHEPKGATRVQVACDRLSEEEGQLHFTFSHEGLVIDLVDKNGEVVKTTSKMFDEVEEDLR